jgi:NhaP-type Na+/H+ and K+/H+ antiporters
MQLVLWFVGLRGAIAYALAENMPGENGATYVTATLSICLTTTIICGGFTERILSISGMKDEEPSDEQNVESEEEDSLVLSAANGYTENASWGIKEVLLKFDRNVLQLYFGGKVRSRRSKNDGRSRGNYELGILDSTDDQERYLD